jgi:hypothetical protein
MGIDWCARVGGFDGRTKNRAAVARFWPTQRGGCFNCVVGTHLGRDTPGFRGWKVGIEPCARKG